MKRVQIDSIYYGNLKREEKYEVLKDDYICMTDVDTTGHLKKETKENIVFVKLIKCETEAGKKQHLAVCLKCNSKEKSESLQQMLGRRVKVSMAFEGENIKPCIHSRISEALHTKEKSKEAKQLTDKCKVLVNDEKQHLAASFDGQTYGLIFVNKARQGNKGNCQKCKSVQCKHVKCWDQELKKKVLATEEENNEEQISEDEEEDEVVEAMKSNQKLNYPFDEITHEKMRKIDSENYKNLVKLTSVVKQNEKCSHGNNWDQDDPVKNEWIYSKKVKIAHSSYVENKERTVYYRTGLRKIILRLITKL